MIHAMRCRDQYLGVNFQLTKLRDRAVSRLRQNVNCYCLTFINECCVTARAAVRKLIFDAVCFVWCTICVLFFHCVQRAAFWALDGDLGVFLSPLLLAAPPSVYNLPLIVTTITTQLKPPSVNNESTRPR